MTIGTLLFPQPIRRRSYPTIGALAETIVTTSDGGVRYEGTPTVEVSDGSEWPDVLGVGGRGPQALISQRVLDGCKNLMKRDRLDFGLVTVRATAGKLKGQTAKYYYLNAPAGITVSHDQPDVPYAIPVKPVMSTWSGDAVVRPTTANVPYWYVSEQVVDLATEQKWTGIAFHPMDLGIGPHPDWDEILPRKGWRNKLYPQPATGTPEADAFLISKLLSEDGGASYEARLALFERGQQVLPILSQRFKEETDLAHKTRLAQVLSGMAHQGVAVPRDIYPEVIALGKGG